MCLFDYGCLSIAFVCGFVVTVLAGLLFNSIVVFFDVVCLFG